MASQPTTIRSWQFSSTSGGLENNLTLSAAAPMPTPKPNQHLVRVVAAALNPVDYKIIEVGFIGRFIVSKPATPSSDFAGYIAVPAQGSDLKAGTPVFGCTGTTPMSGGALREYAIAKPDQVAPAPEGLSMTELSGVGIAGATAYLSIIPHLKSGSRVFINGGSGGTGVYGIQIAKAIGAHVTVTCSTPNVELCKSLGADEVIDYKTQDVLQTLKASSAKFDHVVDNVGDNQPLYFRAHEYCKPTAKYLVVGGSPTLAFLSFSLKARLLPSFLGGGKLPFLTMFAVIKTKDLAQIGQWMKEGKVKTVVDSKYELEQAKDAFKKLKTGRAKGKIVVKVGEEEK